MVIRVDDQLWFDFEESEGEQYVRFTGPRPVRETFQLVRDVGGEMVGGLPWERTSEFAPDIYEFREADPCPGGAEFVIETADFFKPFVEEFVRRLELRGWSGDVGGPLQVQTRQRDPDAMRFTAFYQTLDAQATRNACAAVVTWLTDRHDDFVYYAHSQAPCVASELRDLVDIAHARSVTFSVFVRMSDMVVEWGHWNLLHPRSAGYVDVRTAASGTDLEPDLQQLVASVGSAAPCAGVLPPSRKWNSGAVWPVPRSHVLAPLPMQVMSSELAARFAADPRWSLERLSESTVLVTNQEFGMFDRVDLATPGFERFDDIAVWESVASIEQGSSRRVQFHTVRAPTEPMPAQFVT